MTRRADLVRERPWTDEEEALLRQLWPSSAKVKEIAHRFGRTPQSVVCKAHRIKLQPKRKPLSVNPRKRRRPPSPPPPAPSKRRIVNKPLVARRAVPVFEPPPKPIFTAPPKPLLQWLEPVGYARSCQYPLWQTKAVPRPAMFCGAPTAKRSWCACHAKLVFSETDTYARL